MGCEWITRLGKIMRVAPVERARISVRIKEESVRERMAKLGLVVVSASPELTIDDLRNAILRLWYDHETGYTMEARMSPGALPIYHAISQLEATAWEAGTPTPEFIARMFTPAEPVDN